MGGGGFMQHASDTNRKDRAQKASRRKKFKNNQSDKRRLNSDNNSKIDFIHLTKKKIEKEKRRLKHQFQKKNKKRRIIFLVSTILTIGIIYFSITFKQINSNPFYSIGQPIDSLNHVTVYFNGGVNNTEKRRIIDGYNLGLEYQCVEFVKRYYFEFLNHRMPETYGNAIDFFDPFLKDGDFNFQRGLTQYSNPSFYRPSVNDIVIMDKTIFNSYGHVAIISAVNDSSIEIIKQNAGPYSSTRKKYSLSYKNKKWNINYKRILGRLRKE